MEEKFLIIHLLLLLRWSTELIFLKTIQPKLLDSNLIL